VATLWKRTGEPNACSSTLTNVSDFDFASPPEHHPVTPDAAAVRPAVAAFRADAPRAAPPTEPRFKWRLPASVRRRRPQR
jgi:hypothetical protein